MCKGRSAPLGIWFAPSIRSAVSQRVSPPLQHPPSTDLSQSPASTRAEGAPMVPHQTRTSHSSTDLTISLSIARTEWKVNSCPQRHSATAVSRPFLPQISPIFRHFSPVLSVSAPGSQTAQNNGGKTAQNGRKTAEKQWAKVALGYLVVGEGDRLPPRRALRVALLQPLV